MGHGSYALCRPNVPAPFPNVEPANGCFERIIFHQGLLQVSGWMLLADHPFSSFQLWLDGRLVGTSGSVSRSDLADVYAWIPHARDSGFRFDTQAPIRERTTVRLDVLGCQGSKELARLSTWFTLDIDQAVPTPPPALMKRVVGMEDAHVFKLTGLKCCGEFVDALDRHREPRTVRRLLDWGCGCGRVTAHLMNLAHGSEVNGCDIDAEAIQWCNDHLGRGLFSAIEPWPPTPYENGSFDVVLGCSVFTHLTRDAQRAWLEEMRRIIEPGGLLLTSVLGPFVIRFSFLPGLSWNI